MQIRIFNTYTFAKILVRNKNYLPHNKLIRLNTSLKAKSFQDPQILIPNPKYQIPNTRELVDLPFLLLAFSCLFYFSLLCLSDHIDLR
jgi:hypothetical protein